MTSLPEHLRIVIPDSKSILLKKLDLLDDSNEKFEEYTNGIRNLDKSLSLLGEFESNKGNYVVKIYTDVDNEKDMSKTTITKGNLAVAINNAEIEFQDTFKLNGDEIYCIVNVQLGNIKFHVPSKYWSKYRNR